MKFLGNPSSGSTANLTYSHNRAGQYTRNRRAPVQPIGTGRRAFIRAAFGAASQGWSALDPDTQAAWTSYALLYPVVDSLGQSITLTGQQMYVSIDTQAINTGIGPVTDPPASNAQDTIEDVTLTFGTTAAPLVTVAFSGGSADNYVNISFAPPQSAGRSFVKTFWQATSQSAATGTYAGRVAFENQFGTTYNGQKIFVKVTPVNQYGVTGTPIIVSSIIARS